MINEKLLNIQNELKAPKDQYNDFGKYKYRSCENILESVKPLLKKNGCTLVLSDEIIYVGERYYIKATATLRCGEESISNTAFAREEESRKGMSADQLTGSTSSYARKYALNGLFAIDDTKDSDATNKGEEEPKKEPKKFEPKKEVLQVNDDGITTDQIEELNSLGYSLAQVVAKLNKPSTKITWEEMEEVIQKCRKAKGID